MIKFNIKIIEPILKLFNNIINKQENILFYDIVGAWRSLSRSSDTKIVDTRLSLIHLCAGFKSIVGLYSSFIGPLIYAVMGRYSCPCCSLKLYACAESRVF